MSAITHLFAGVPVSNLDASIDWYTRFFGRPQTARRRRDSLGDRRARVALHRAERGACGRGPDHPRRRWARRAPQAHRCPAHRARTDRDLLERCPPRERPRSGWERDRVRRAAQGRERVTSIGRTRVFIMSRRWKSRSSVEGSRARARGSCGSTWPWPAAPRRRNGLGTESLLAVLEDGLESADLCW